MYIKKRIFINKCLKKYDKIDKLLTIKFTFLFIIVKINNNNIREDNYHIIYAYNV